MNKIQKFNTFLKEIYTNHTNKSLIEGVIDAFSSIFEADTEENENPEAGRSGLGPSGQGNINLRDSAKMKYRGYGSKIEQKPRQGMKLEPSSLGVLNKRHGKYRDAETGLIVDGNQEGNFAKGGENTKVNELGDKELMFTTFNKNSLSEMDSDLANELRTLIQYQQLRSSAFDKDDLQSIGLACYKIIKSGNKGMVNAEQATNKKITTHEDVANVIKDLNQELSHMIGGTSKKTDDEIYDDVQSVIRPVKILLNKASNAAFKEVEKVSSAFNAKQGNFERLSEQEARSKGLDMSIFDEKAPYYELGRKYSEKLVNSGATVLGSTNEAEAIESILKEMGESPESNVMKEIFKEFRDVKNMIDTKVNATVFKNAFPISVKVGESYRSLGNPPIKWEDLYAGKGRKAQSLISNFKAFNDGVFTMQSLNDAVGKYASLVKKSAVDPSVKIPNVINKVPLKFIKLYYSLIKGGTGANDINTWLKEQTEYIMKNAAVDDKILTETFNNTKKTQLDLLKNGSLLRKLIEHMTFDVNAYKKLIVNRTNEIAA